MTQKQERFVQEYLLDMNAKQAAMRAGYAESTASKKAALWVGKSRCLCPKNMRHVWDAVHTELKARNERIKLDADWVLFKAREIVERCMQDVRPCVVQGKQQQDTNGNLLYTFDASGALRALELIGKHTQVNAFKSPNNDNGMPDDIAERLMKATRIARLREKYREEQMRKQIKAEYGFVDDEENVDE